MALRIVLRLATGREVELSRLFLLPSVVDWSNPLDPKRMVEQLPTLVERLIGPDIPWLVKNPRESDFFPIACIALFESSPMISHAVTIEHSLLVVCWFSENVDLPLRNIACEGLSEIDWEKHAKDFHSDW